MKNLVFLALVIQATLAMADPTPLPNVKLEVAMDGKTVTTETNEGLKTVVAWRGLDPCFNQFAIALSGNQNSVQVKTEMDRIAAKYQAASSALVGIYRPGKDSSTTLVNLALRLFDAKGNKIIQVHVLDSLFYRKAALCRYLDSTVAASLNGVDKDVDSAIMIKKQHEAEANAAKVGIIPVAANSAAVVDTGNQKTYPVLIDRARAGKDLAPSAPRAQ